MATDVLGWMRDTMESKNDREKYVMAVIGNDGPSSGPNTFLHTGFLLHITHLIKALLCAASQDLVRITWARTGPPFRRLGFRDLSSILRSIVWGNLNLRGPQFS
jgi:hypothetical protein